MKKIIIAGGGTGGHIFPAIAIANALRRVDESIDILFVGAKGKMEMEKVPQAGYPIQGIDIAGFNRGSLLKNIGLPFKLIKSFFEVKNIFKSFSPDAVIGVGGYSTFPVLRSAQKKGIPTFVHESNSFAGKSNILLGKDASKIFVACDGMEKFFPKEKILITGNPVRKEIVENKVPKSEALEHFELSEERKTILIIGGSLGARSINEAIIMHLPDFATLNLQLIWQTGKYQSSRYISRGQAFKNVFVSEFIQDMNWAYAAADVVISRAGAMSVAEISVVGKPAVFVPYPFAAEDHQTVNATYLVNKQAALLVDDSSVQTQLFSTITNLVFDETRMAEMKKNIAPLAITNAGDRIAKEIMDYLNK